MITLKCSEFIYLDNKTGYRYDIQVREYEDEGRVIYFAQGSQTVQIFEEDIDKVFEFIRKARELPLIEERQGFLK